MRPCNSSARWVRVLLPGPNRKLRLRDVVLFIASADPSPPPLPPPPSPPPPSPPPPAHDLSQDLMQAIDFAHSSAATGSIVRIRFPPGASVLDAPLVFTESIKASVVELIGDGDVLTLSPAGEQQWGASGALLFVKDGARLRVRGFTLHPPASMAAMAVEGGQLEVDNCSFAGGG